MLSHRSLHTRVLRNLQGLAQASQHGDREMMVSQPSFPTKRCSNLVGSAPAASSQLLHCGDDRERPTSQPARPMASMDSGSDSCFSYIFQTESRSSLLDPATHGPFAMLVGELLVLVLKLTAASMCVHS